jgi:hypothetical protein
MKNDWTIRKALFLCGVVALAISFVLLVGSFFRPVVPGNPWKQAAAVRPWVNWGLGWAAAGLVLSFFGERRQRMLGVAMGMLLLAWWYGARTVLGG